MCDGNTEKRVISYNGEGTGDMVVVYDSGNLFQVGFELALGKKKHILTVFGINVVL